MKRFRKIKIFTLAIAICVTLDSCFMSFSSKKNERLLNETLESERKHKQKISILERENRVFFDRNLSLEKKKKLLEIELEQLQRDHKNLNESYERDKQAFQLEKENLQKQISILREKGEKRITELMALHTKQKEELEHRLTTTIKSFEDKIQQLSEENKLKEKNWTEKEFSFKKEFRELTEKISGLNAEILKINADTLLEEQESKELANYLEILLKDESAQNKILLKKGKEVSISIDNNLLYQPFMAEWKKEGLELIKKILKFPRDEAARFHNFSVKVSVYTSSRWLDMGKTANLIIKVPIGPPPRDKKLSQDDMADYLKHQWQLAHYPFPVALAALRVWKWEKLFYESYTRFQGFSLQGIPKPKTDLPWEGATVLQFQFIVPENKK
jgi:hypothetical protein